MASAIRHVTFDSGDPYTRATFWAAVLAGSRADGDHPGDAAALVTAGAFVLPFGRMSEEKKAKNRVTSTCSRWTALAMRRCSGFTAWARPSSPTGGGRTAAGGWSWRTRRATSSAWSTAPPSVNHEDPDDTAARRIWQRRRVATDDTKT